jgi:hypothetical protein
MFDPIKNRTQTSRPSARSLSLYRLRYQNYFLFTYDLFDDTVSSSGCIALVCLMNSVLEMILKKVAVVWPITAAARSKA